MAKVRQPKIQIWLQKNVSRTMLAGGVPASQRYSGRAPVVDLSPYLGDHGAVRVMKSVRSAAGSFSITLADRVNPDGLDSMYGLIEPMDMIEIRLVSDAYLIGAQTNFPVLMRGFVSDVSRSEGMDGQGKPQRSVTITGQDYGKIWQIQQLFLMPFLPADATAMLSSFPFFARFGIGGDIQPAATFAQSVVDKLLNPYLASMSKEDISPVQLLGTDISVTDGAVSPFGLGGWSGGSVYALLMQFGDVGPWNELFIEDRDDRPYLVYRPNPFMSADGSEFILPQATENGPGFIPITASDVMGLQATRSDCDLANYFWVDAPTYAMTRPEIQRLDTYQGDPESLFVTNYGNVDPTLYGTRRMTEQTQQANPADVLQGVGQPAGAARDAANLTAAQWITRRRKQLIDQNRDNVMFERGAMRLKGNHLIRAGKYVRLARGRMVSDYYAVAVTHDYLPFGHYVTSVQFERGTGFIDRAQMAAPGYSERAVTDVE
jgi:hypothetical protein